MITQFGVDHPMDWSKVTLGHYVCVSFIFVSDVSEPLIVEDTKLLTGVVVYKCSATIKERSGIILDFYRLNDK